MTKRTWKLLHAFGGSRSASTAIEYALMGALVAAVVVASLPAVGTAVNDLFQEVADALKH